MLTSFWTLISFGAHFPVGEHICHKPISVFLPFLFFSLRYTESCFTFTLLRSALSTLGLQKIAGSVKYLEANFRLDLMLASGKWHLSKRGRIWSAKKILISEEFLKVGPMSSAVLSMLKPLACSPRAHHLLNFTWSSVLCAIIFFYFSTINFTAFFWRTKAMSLKYSPAFFLLITSSQILTDNFCVVDFLKG